MILLETLLNKYFVKKEKSGDLVLDLTRSSISKRKLANVKSVSMYVVDDETKMRPDLVTQRLYGEQNSFDLLLKYNGISNPFSLNIGDILLIPSFENLETLLKVPVKIEDIGAPTDDGAEKLFLNPATTKDKERIKQIRKQVKGGEVLPGNVNKKGDKNIKIEDGKLIFGEDVTSVSRKDCPEPISRANLKKALIKNNLFG